MSTKPLSEILPKSVKVGCYTYSIEIQDQPWCEEHGVYGLCDDESKIITIVDNVDMDSTLNTFQHELLHALYYFFGLDDDHDEEQTVSALSSGLIMLYQDNPSILRIFKKYL